MNVTCRCLEFGPLAARPESIALRVRRADAIRPTLVLLAEHPAERVALYRCRACGTTWQGARSRVALFGQEECLYKVPEIDLAAWRSEPYAKPADVVLHANALRRFHATRAARAGDGRCAKTECAERAVEGESLCAAHLAAQLQETGVLPRPPSGRPFPMLPATSASGTHATVATHGAADAAGADAQHLESVRALA